LDRQDSLELGMVLAGQEQGTELVLLQLAQAELVRLG
jgi:hypothetical protein